MERNETIHRLIKAIEKFITENGYLQNKHVLGIVFYGSYTTGYYHKGSDVDIHIIMDNSKKEIIRAVDTVDGFRFEYFEKSIKRIKESVDIDYETNENAYLTMIGYGRILYDPKGQTKQLQNYILNKYKNPQPPLSGDDVIEAAAILNNKIDELEKMLKENSILFEIYYYRVLDSIRKFYSRRCGCANVPLDKVYKIYTNEKYRQCFCKDKIPDEVFIDMFFDAIKCNMNRQTKFEKAKNLFNYSKKGLKFDNNNYRIRVKDRHNPLSTNHQ